MTKSMVARNTLRKGGQADNLGNQTWARRIDVQHAIHYNTPPPKMELPKRNCVRFIKPLFDCIFL